jgi:hypothetical protein
MSKPSQFMVTSDLPVGSIRSARLRPVPMVRTCCDSLIFLRPQGMGRNVVGRKRRGRTRSACFQPPPFDGRPYFMPKFKLAMDREITFS